MAAQPIYLAAAGSVTSGTEFLRQALLRRRSEIVTRLKDRDEIVVERVADPMDEIDSQQARSFRVDRINSDSSTLREINSALQRLTDGSYGVCLDCEETIAPRRLQAVPWAARCRDCQEQAEQNRAGDSEPLDTGAE